MFNTQVGRMLDEEHRSNLDLLGQVEQAVGHAARWDAKLAPLLRRFAQAMESDVVRHFSFEEEHLFPRIVEAGDGPIAGLMRDEHDTMREVAAELLPLAREAAAGPLDEEAWDRLRLGVLEFVERQVSHIQKETMAVLPLLDDLLDPETDGELALGYAG